MKGLYIGFIAAAAVIAVGLYLSKKNKSNILLEEIVDEVQFDKIVEFFKSKTNVDTKVKAIALMINETSSLKDYDLTYLKGKNGVALVCYNEATNSIDTVNSKVLVSQKLDKLTQEAFGEKEMIIFN